jgi:serine phosphatase RsbU (regulator of sigma subunit)
LFGEDRLISSLKMHPQQNAEEALEFVESCLNEFSDPLPPGDDLTMLAVRRVESK